MFSFVCVSQSVHMGEGPHVTTTHDAMGESRVTCDSPPLPHVDRMTVKHYIPATVLAGSKKMAPKGSCIHYLFLTGSTGSATAMSIS